MYPDAIYQLRNSESFQRYDVILSDLRVDQVRGSLRRTAFYRVSTGRVRGSHVTRGGYTAGSCRNSEIAFARAQCKPMGNCDLNSSGPSEARKLEFLLEVVLKGVFLQAMAQY